MLRNPAQTLPTDRQRKERGRQLLALIALLGLRLDQYAAQFVRGEFTQRQFLFWAMALIRQCHYSAASLGAQAAGSSGYNVYAVARRSAQAQESFLEAFAQDLAAGRYDTKADGGAGARARTARFRLYGLRLTGTANAAWLYALGDIEVLWVLDETERNHCSDCPQQARMGWRKASSLTFTPGSGATKCIVRCKCHLVTRDGRVSFSN